MLKYGQWIAKNIKHYKGECAKATDLMVSVFPELIRVRGHYLCLFDNKRYEHWWTVTDNGNIVDPTKKQFISGGAGEYIPWDENSPEPTCEKRLRMRG